MIPINNMSSTHSTQPAQDINVDTQTAPAQDIQNLISRRVDVNTPLTQQTLSHQNNLELNLAVESLFNEIETSDFDTFSVGAGPITREPTLREWIERTLNNHLSIITDSMTVLYSTPVALLRAATNAACSIEQYIQISKPDGQKQHAEIIHSYINSMPDSKKDNLRAFMHTTSCRRAYEIIEIHCKIYHDTNAHVLRALNATKEFIVQCTVLTNSTEQSNINIQAKTPIWVEKVDDMNASECLFMAWFVLQFDKNFPSSIFVLF